MKYLYSIFKFASIFILVFVFCNFFTPAINDAQAVWNCDNTSRQWNPDYDYQRTIDTRSTRSRIIRPYSPYSLSSIPWGWGQDNCVTCPDPSGCGNCECRCMGNKLYCADIWVGGDGRLRSSTCTELPKDQAHPFCTPTSVIASPANNSTYVEGQNNVLLKANLSASDAKGEDWRAANFNWIIRPINPSGADITRTGDNISIDSWTVLNPGVYYVFLQTTNAAIAYSDWSFRSRIVVNEATVTGNLNVSDTRCADGTSNSGIISASISNIGGSFTSGSLQYQFRCPGQSWGSWTTVNSKECNVNNPGSYIVYAKVRRVGAITIESSTYSKNITVPQCTLTGSLNLNNTQCYDGSADSGIVRATATKTGGTAFRTPIYYKFDCGSGYGSESTNSFIDCKYNIEGTKTIRAVIRQGGISTTLTETETVCRTPECGSAILSSHTNEPNSSLCDHGDPSSVSYDGTGLWKWSCDSTYNSDTVNCQAPRLSQCGDSADFPQYGTPTDLCEYGTDLNLTENASSWTWDCKALLTTETTPCTTQKQNFELIAPEYIEKGTPLSLSYTSENIDWCFGYRYNGSICEDANILDNWNDYKTTNTSATWTSTSPLNDAKSFGFYCGLNNPAPDNSATECTYKTIKVADLDVWVGTPSFPGGSGNTHLNIEEGDQVRISWASSNMDDCIASVDGYSDTTWNGSRNEPSKYLEFIPSLGPQITPYKYKLSCDTIDAANSLTIEREIDITITPCTPLCLDTGSPIEVACDMAAGDPCTGCEDAAECAALTKKVQLQTCNKTCPDGSTCASCPPQLVDNSTCGCSDIVNWQETNPQ